MTLTLRPIADTQPAHRNLYSDWLDTLTAEQFYQHVAGNYPAPEIGAPSISITRMWGLALASVLACLAVLFIVNHL